MTGPRKTLVIACGALAREFLAVVEANGWSHLDVTCLPAIWHNHPERIPEGVRRKIRAGRRTHDEILCLYGDCGTGGLLDRVLAEEGVERIDGPHCYAFFAGLDAFEAMQDQEIGTFYLTDFLVRHFERFVIKGLGLDRHPELLPVYFGNYTRVVYLQQMPDPALTRKAEAAARRLGLRLELRQTGLGGVEAFLAPREAAAG
ncbi:DUF1638 domain-containing protein [Labrys wisconsinensis]|uniref:DUF1638 domain-containing protein n=1 Tax=Labrys wisconsinensis TaxID=425677 RepID=A0ABU0JK11_9HYPH|nr:DUF1638 domain-containing protein [Labrys wisconsinensis]MDQ0473821.1 hypothetical protein [Labrys wisconsinensis]